MHQAAAIRRHPVVGGALLLLALVVPLVPTAADARPPERALVVEVLSSAPDQVTDGDALVRVEVPQQVPAGKVTVLAGGRDVTGTFEPSADGRSLVGVVTGLPLGPTEIVAKANGSGVGRPEPGRVTVVNHPIERSDLLGPAAAAVRVHDGAGHLRRASPARPAASSTTRTTSASPSPPKDADGQLPERRPRLPDRRRPRSSAGARTAPRPTQDRLRLQDDRRAASSWLDDPTTAARRRRDHDDPRRADRALRRPLGARHDQPLHLQRRHARAVDRDRPARPDDSLWNGRLVFSLQGGVAIGHTRARSSAGAMLFEPCCGRATRSSARPDCARTRTTTSSSAARPR